jgi:hypothetical protein
MSVLSARKIRASPQTRQENSASENRKARAALVGTGNAGSAISEEGGPTRGICARLAANEKAQGFAVPQNPFRGLAETHMAIGLEPLINFAPFRREISRGSNSSFVVRLDVAVIFRGGRRRGFTAR